MSKKDSNELNKREKAILKFIEKQIALNKIYLGDFSNQVILEHKVFLELLKGRNINEIFNENGEYITQN